MPRLLDIFKSCILSHPKVNATLKRMFDERGKLSMEIDDIVAGNSICEEDIEESSNG